MSNSKFNRRDILSLMGVGSGASLLNSPLLVLIDAIVSGSVTRAYAQDSGIVPRRWVDFFMPGGPSRWGFDLMLRPYAGGAPFVSNPQVATRYVAAGGRYTNVQYSTVALNGMNVPHIWQFPVPAADGGTRPMADLLDNFLNLRGIDTGNPGHAGSIALHFLPLGVTQSLPALAGDWSTSPIPAVYTPNGFFRYKSATARSAALLSGGDLIRSLMDPFQSVASASFKNAQAPLRTHINQVKQALFANAENAHGGAELIANAVRGADQVILGSFGNLATVWTGLLAKYRSLMMRALSQSEVIPGINDLPIGITGTRNGTYDAGPDPGRIVTNADLRTMITASTIIPNLAESFAVAEFILRNDLSHSMTFTLPPFVGLSINGTTRSGVADEHAVGKMVCTFLNAFYARAQAACLLELIDQLKLAGTFSNTVINVCGEFNRSARENGTGSDHGYQGASMAMYSGAINGPMVVGNILADSPGAAAGGTWGYGAPTGGQMLDLGHMIATVARVLRVPSPTAAKSSILAVNSNGDFVPAPGIGLGTSV